MASTTKSLTGQQKLQFIIVPSSIPSYEHTYVNNDKTGILIFREAEKTIEVNGVKYGADNTTEFTNLTAALETLEAAGLGSYNEQTKIYTATAPITCTETTITLPTPDGGTAPTDGTIAEFLKQLQTEINALNTKIGSDSVATQITAAVEALDETVYGAGSNGTSATSTTGSAAATSFSGDTTNKVVVKITEADGKLTDVTVKTNDIASAAALQTLDGAAVKSVNGQSPTSGAVTITGTNIAVSASDLDTLDTVAAKAKSAVQSVSLTSGGNTITSTLNNAVTGALGADNIYLEGATASGNSNITIGAKLTALENSISQTSSSAALKLYKVEGSTETELDGSTTALAKHISADGTTYRIKQGNGLVAEFNIEKDSFVREGTLVYAPATGVEGDTSTNYTATTADGTNTTPYLKLTLKTTGNGANDEQDSNQNTISYVYIKAANLVDVYQTGSSTSDAVQIAVSNHQITASLKNGAAHTEYSNVVSNVPTAAADGLLISVTTTDGAVSAVSGSIAANTYDAYGAAATVQTTVVGNSGDAKTADTVNGAKAFATDAATTAAHTAETNAKEYADSICTWTIISNS